MSTASSWKFYAWRPVGNIWLDTDVQLRDCSLKYCISTMNSGQIILPVPDQVPMGSDGRPVWGKWDTVFLAERNSVLDWVGIADAVTPDANGLTVPLVGLSAWLSKVDYSSVYTTWQRDTFDVVRELIDHATAKPRGINFVRDNSNSTTTVGDPQPPPKPRKPPRHKGEKKSDYTSSARYHTWETDLQNWKNNWGSNQQYKLLWWENPNVGKAFNDLANETGFDWRERYSWTAPLTPQFKIDFADNLVTTRTDYAVIDGVNVVGRLTPTYDDVAYANKVIMEGAGHGRKMLRKIAIVDDGRLYAARYARLKRQKHAGQLQRAANQLLSHTRRLDPQIGTVNVYDVEGMAPTETLKAGDVITVRSDYLVPRINVQALIRSKTETPLNPGIVQLELETRQS